MLCKMLSNPNVGEFIKVRSSHLLLETYLLICSLYSRLIHLASVGESISVPSRLILLSACSLGASVDHCHIYLIFFRLSELQKLPPAQVTYAFQFEAKQIHEIVSVILTNRVSSLLGKNLTTVCFFSLYCDSHFFRIAMFSHPLYPSSIPILSILSLRQRRIYLLLLSIHASFRPFN